MYAINPLIMFIALQVPLLIIGPAAGMASVVAYTTVRTLARLPLQISSQISFSLYTEYTRLHAEGRMDLVQRLFNKGLAMIAALFAAYAVGGMLLGPWVYQLWLKHVPAGFHLLFGVLLLDAAFESFMRNKVALTSSLNRHARDTLFQLALVCLGVGTMWAMAQSHSVLSDILWPVGLVSLGATLWVLVAGWREIRMAS